jgi:glycine cleavage system H protein
MKLYYTDSHEYIRVEGETGTVGITDFAQSQLGDVVFVDIPQIGSVVAQGNAAAAIDSVKAAAEVNAPVSGEIIDTNGALAETPALVNEDPMGKGWILKIKIGDSAELGKLMDEGVYREFVKSVS